MIRILPLFLTLTMLVGSVGVTVNRHFCMGELKSLTLFGASATCEMHPPVAKPPCPLHGESQQPAADRKGCCDDEAQFLSWDDDRQLSEINPLPPLAWVAVTTPLPPFPPRALHLRAAELRPYQNYRPPPLVIDVPRAWQVFRL